MNNSDIASLRLHNQRLINSNAEEPGAVVAWLGAVQSQDYAGARWALGMRTPGISDSDIDRMFNDGTILRTHVMRPTWHFVTPEDIRWMLALTAPRVRAAMASTDRQVGLDTSIFKKSN